MGLNMRLPQHIVIFTPFILSLASCASAPVKVQEKPAEPEVVTRDYARVKDTSFRGQLKFENNQAIYTPCNSDTQYQISKNDILQSVYNKVTDNQQKPVYIEFDGEITFNKDSNSQSAVLLRIDKTHHMALAKASLQCAKPIDSYDFKAQGNDPYWRINMQEQKLFFATKASNQSYLLNDANFKASQSNRLKSVNEDGQPLILSIEPGHCYTKDSKDYWGYITKAETTFGVFTGCGEPGRLSTEQNISGYYLSEHNGKEINLSLNEDHTLEYKITHSEKETTKQGYWKSNTPGEVVAMLTKQGNSNIREEVIFNRSGLTLTANEINQNNVITEFSPLTFNKMDKKHNPAGAQPVVVQRQFTAQRISPERSIDLEVQKALQQYFKIHRTDPKNTKFNAVRFDLNGDGKNEAIVLLDWCSSAGCEALIFENKNNQLSFSSRIAHVEPPLMVGKQQHFSWQSLLVKVNNNLVRLNFDGLSYPLSTRAVENKAHASDSTGVILFNKGRPTTWYPIK